MSTTSNKDKIFQAAVRLFAQKGYANVSMREIAREVEIKAASIYNHYSGKEALFDAIVDYFRDELQKQVYKAYEITEDLNARYFLEKTLEVNESFFRIPVISDISTIIFREQFQNEKIRTMLLEELIKQPRKVYAKYFEKLMALGHIRSMNPVMLAIEYHSYFIYRFYENSLATQYSQIDFEKLKEEQEEHVNLFLKNYSTN